MHWPPKDPRPALWTLVALVTVALAACAPAAVPTAVGTPSSVPTKTAAVFETSTPIPTPAQFAPPTPEPPTATPDLSVTITHVEMIDETTGWAEGQVGADPTTRILRTTDGGGTWRDVSPMECDSSFLHSKDADFAWVGGDPVCLTTDAGQTWISYSVPGDDVWFNDSRHGWSLAAEAWGLSFRQFDISSFATTNDGGENWEEKTPPPGGGVAYMAYPDPQTAWVVRAGFAKSIDGVPNLAVPFHIHTTLDSGGTWVTREMPLPEGTDVVYWPGIGDFLGGAGNCEFVSPVYSSDAVWKAALTCETKSWIYTSASQGKTWIISPMPAGLFTVVQFATPATGWLFVQDRDVRTGRLYGTVDGGQTWTLIKRTGWLNVELSFVDAETGWAVACAESLCYGAAAERALVKTSDGGRTWQTLEPLLIP